MSAYPSQELPLNFRFSGTSEGTRMGLCVLVVDDSVLTRHAIERKLLRTNQAVSAVLQASNGEEALIELWRQRVDLIVCDVDMPVMDGLRFLDAKNLDPLIRHIPVVMTSTEVTEGRMKQVRARGVHAFLQKPFPAESMSVAIIEALAYAHIAAGERRSQEGQREARTAPIVRLPAPQAHSNADDRPK